MVGWRNAGSRVLPSGARPALRRQDEWFPYLHCLEENLGKGGQEEWSRDVHRRCAQGAGFDEEAIWDCAFGEPQTPWPDAFEHSPRPADGALVVLR